ncbi:MAG: VOC family protein [Acidobacteria bacterium]|nr:VOC family protein [Acidobacteriota bacterium]MBI3421798.1 VOC family protein [Acidobacteriota bacterium]
MDMSKLPPGSGKHPIPFVVISANDIAASIKFYAELFGWQPHAVSAELTGAVVPAGPNVAWRSGLPDGFPSAVPYLGVPDVDAALERIVAAGGSVEHAAWDVPMAGRLARFKDLSGTIYGLTNGVAPGTMLPHIPMPFGSNPKPPAGTLCSLEMYAADGKAAARFFGALFGWGTLETMPQYMAFDPGAGIGGVFQSHTPGLPAVAYIYVTDVVAKIAEIEAAGGARMGDPMPIPGMACFGYFKDPSGSSMGLIGP